MFTIHLVPPTANSADNTLKSTCVQLVMGKSVGRILHFCNSAVASASITSVFHNCGGNALHTHLQLYEWSLMRRKIKSLWSQILYSQSVWRRNQGRFPVKYTYLCTKHNILHLCSSFLEPLNALHKISKHEKVQPEQHLKTFLWWVTCINTENYPCECRATHKPLPENRVISDL